MKERRKHKRYFFKALLKFADAGEYSNIQLESINLSAGGIFFRTNKNISEGETLNLIFTLPEHQRPIVVKCATVHSVEAIPNKQYYMGVKFLEIDGISEEGLQKNLKEHFEDDKKAE